MSIWFWCFSSDSEMKHNLDMFLTDYCEIHRSKQQTTRSDAKANQNNRLKADHIAANTEPITLRSVYALAFIVLQIISHTHARQTRVSRSPACTWQHMHEIFWVSGYKNSGAHTRLPLIHLKDMWSERTAAFPAQAIPHIQPQCCLVTVAVVMWSSPHQWTTCD